MPLKTLKKTGETFARVYRALKGSLAAAFFFHTVFIVNAVQFISLVFLPFSKNAFFKANQKIPAIWLSVAVWWAKNICGVQFIMTGDELKTDENAVIIVNHQSFADAVALFALVHKYGRLGDLSYFAKDSIKFWPGIGWGLRFVNCIFLKRNWDIDRARLDDTFSKITRNNLPFWFINFVEGTRLTPEKLERSRAYARRRGIFSPRHVLIPRTRGFTAAVEALRDRTGAVYDVAIGYEQSAPSLWRLMKGLVDRVHIHVHRFPLDELPKDAGGLSVWLIERFEDKDRLLDRFYSDGRFSD